MMLEIGCLDNILAKQWANVVRAVNLVNRGAWNGRYKVDTLTNVGRNTQRKEIVRAKLTSMLKVCIKSCLY
jgi:hypothetical protein